MADPVPHDIRQLADERARARRARAWATADRIKGELEAAGWRVEDAGTLYSLERLPPAVVEVDGELRYGSSVAVPSRLEEPASPGVTVVLAAQDRAGVLPTAVGALLRELPARRLVVVADAPSPGVGAELVLLPAGIDVVRLTKRLGLAAAWNAGIRRVATEAVLVLDPRVEVDGEIARAAVAALADPGVAVAGVRGLTSEDLVHLKPAPDPAGDVFAVDRLAMAFRRADYVARGPLDEHFVLGDYLDAWWSFVLRDPAEGEAAEPRRAVLLSTPVTVRGEDALSDERIARKQRYRFLKSFATRRDLLVEAAG